MHLSNDVATTDTDDGMVLLHQRTGRYWQLNATGAFVLHRLLNDGGVDQIATELAENHGIDPQRAREDVEAVIAQTRQAGLVVST